MKPTPQQPIPPRRVREPAAAPPPAGRPGLQALRRDLLRPGAWRLGALRLGALPLGGLRPGDLRLPVLQPSPLRLSPWRLSLVAALLLHLLAASAWQLSRSRQRPPARLTAADDTPILLQFSREAPGDAVPLAIPLPPAVPLPLPPAAPAELPARPGAAPPAARPAARGDLAAPARSTPAQSRGGKGSAIPARRPPSPAAAISPPDLSAGAPARQALERALEEAVAGTARSDLPPPPGRETAGEGRGEAGAEAAAARSGAAATGAGSEGLANPAPTADHQATAADRRLWGLARPTALPAAPSRDGLPRGLELRHLPLALARRSGANPVHQRSLHSDGRLTVLWIDGPTLWLLRLPIPASRGAG